MITMVAHLDDEKAAALDLEPTIQSKRDPLVVSALPLQRRFVQSRYFAGTQPMQTENQAIPGCPCCRPGSKTHPIGSRRLPKRGWH